MYKSLFYYFFNFFLTSNQAPSNIHSGQWFRMEARWNDKTGLSTEPGSCRSSSISAPKDSSCTDQSKQHVTNRDIDLRLLFLVLFTKLEKFNHSREINAKLIDDAPRGWLTRRLIRTCRSTRSSCTMVVVATCASRSSVKRGRGRSSPHHPHLPAGQ